MVFKKSYREDMMVAPSQFYLYGCECNHFTKQDISTSKV